MKRVLGEDHKEISPTVGFNIKSLEFGEYLLNLWDVGGQKSIRTYWRNYFEQTDGIIWVVDSVDRFRMEECRDQLREILQQEVRSFCGCLRLDLSSFLAETGGQQSVDLCQQTRPRRRIVLSNYIRYIASGC